jgi:ribosomal protein L29
MHAKEIDQFDESTYQELVKRLDDLKEKQPE